MIFKRQRNPIFLSELVQALGRLLVERAHFRSTDLALFMQQSGAEALPIITLVSTECGV